MHTFWQRTTKPRNDYGNGVIHNRTTEFNMFNIYKRKYYERNVDKILATGNVRKPTDIIIFTDGFSFSCGSVFVKGLQVYGSAIVVGYNTKPGITSPKDFDATIKFSSGTIWKLNLFK